MEAPGDHEVKDEPEIAFEAHADAFAEAPEAENFFAEGSGKGRSDGAEEKGAGDADRLERLAEDAGVKSFEVDGDIGKLGHGVDGSETRSGNIVQRSGEDREQSRHKRIGSAKVRPQEVV